MKNLVFVLLALLAVPAFAVSTMTVGVVDNGDGTGTVQLTAITGAPPVGIGLVVDANDGADGDAVVNVTAPAGGSFFDVYIDYYSTTITAMNDNDFSDDGGTPGANPAIAGVLTAGSAVSLSMGELDDVNNADDMTLPIDLAIVDLGGAGDFTINIDALRGGIVDVNLGEVTLTNAGATFAVTDGPAECFPSGHADYTEWLAVGSPDSWCGQFQCYGDADDQAQTVGKSSYRVSTFDLGVLVAGWQKTYVDPVTTPWIAADFSRSSQSVGKASYRVSTEDLAILVSNWQKTTTASLPACQ